LACRASVNNLIGEWLCALPSLTTLAHYRKPHMDHHRLLGDPTGDPDYLAPDPAGRGWVRRWLAMIVDRRHFFQTILGTIPAMSRTDLLWLACWWVCSTGTLSAFVGVLHAATFLAVWLLARVAVYYPLSTFREMADHYGLDPSSWLGYTRNVESGSLLAAVIHPHQDGYHLVHHLIPTIPFHRTKAAHKLLLRVPVYDRLHNCDGYFGGRHPLANCLNRACQPPSRETG
jgi:fatty acid desaturase